MILNLTGILELFGKLVLLMLATSTNKDKDYFIVRNCDKVVHLETLMDTTVKMFIINKYQGKSVEERQSRRWLSSMGISIRSPWGEIRFSLRKALLTCFLFHHKIRTAQPTEKQKWEIRRLGNLEKRNC